MVAPAFDTAGFTDALNAAGVQLPVRLGDDYGIIEDATALCILVADANRDLPDSQVDAMCRLIALAINHAGGFG